MTALKQTSFAGGEIAPNLYGRSDLTKWQAGLATCRNFWINRYGNAENRPGTEFCGNTRLYGAARLVAFTVTLSQSYFLEIGYDTILGSGYAIPWKNGAQLTLPAATQTVWSSGTTYANGQIVVNAGLTQCYISLADGNLNNVVTDATHWRPLGMLTVGGVLSALVEIAMPWNSASLPLVQWAQNNQVMTFVAQAFAPVQLEYHADNWWRLNSSVLSNPVGAPTACAAAVGVAGGNRMQYRVIGVAADLTTQGPVGLGPVVAVTNITDPGSLGSPITVTTGAAHGYATGDVVRFNFSKLCTAGVDYTITVTGGTTFTFGASSGFAVAFVNPGGVQSASCGVTCGTPTAANPNTITWTAAANAARYNIYEWYQGAWCFIGSTTGTTFQDINITPNVGFQPSIDIPMFQSSLDWPAVVGVYQQRLWFANTKNQPQSYWASRIGYYGVFSVGTPNTASDAFTFVLAGKQTQFINALIDIGKLIIHTSAGEFVLNGDQGGAVNTNSQNVAQIGNAGCAPGIPPVAIGLTDLFVQARGGVVRDLAFDVQAFNYQGKDTTLFASHLFAGATIVDMDYQQVPNSQVWCVLSTGEVVVMTYLKEHGMWAWSRHDTGTADAFESICIVPEGQEEAIYAVVRRYMANGSIWRNVERLHNRAFADIAVDACFTDSSLTFDGRNVTGATMTATTTGGWTTSDVLTITAAGATFAATDATNGNVILLRQFDARGNLVDQVALTIIGYTDATHVAATAQKPVPAWAQGLPIITWGKMVGHFSGAANLAGQTISILGDGNIETGIACDSTGAFVTQGRYLVLHAGLPITAQIQTLDWENQQGDSIAGKKKNINELTVVFIQSRGGKYGMNLANLATFPRRAGENWDQPDFLLNGPYRFPLAGQWATTASVWFQQTDPLPLCIGAVIPSGAVGN